jgi:membrane protease YdiL (CAAX protease family)
LVFGLIMAYIWDLRYSYHRFWLIILGLMLLSHWRRREKAKSLGFDWRSFRPCAEKLAPALLFLVLLLLGGGLLFSTTRPMGWEGAMTAWTAYMPWGVFQQYALNGYFLNRIDRVVSSRAAPILTAALFSSVHLPNWFLMAVTLLAGYGCTWLYRRYRNLYSLGLAHGTLGFLLYLVIPDSISHHLVVGPGWFTH